MKLNCFVFFASLLACVNTLSLKTDERLHLRLAQESSSAYGPIYHGGHHLVHSSRFALYETDPAKESRDERIKKKQESWSKRHPVLNGFAIFFTLALLVVMGCFCAGG